MNPINHVYDCLLAFYGPQGWWPIVDPAIDACTYHIGAPRNGEDFFEICVGAILTQNIAWKNVERALTRLKARGMLNPETIRTMRPSRLGEIIRTTGYYNQKAKKLRNFTEWYRRYRFDHTDLAVIEPRDLRKELLSVSGIGPETADSILLYALRMNYFVVDAYTKRIFTRIGILSGDEKYDGIQELFHSQFKGTVSDYNEYHALIVAHGKGVCSTRPSCDACCLRDVCAGNF